MRASIIKASVNDVTAADVLNETPDFAQWCRSKGYDTFGCIGPVIATTLTSVPLGSSRGSVMSNVRTTRYRT